MHRNDQQAVPPTELFPPGCGRGTRSDCWGGMLSSASPCIRRIGTRLPTTDLSGEASAKLTPRVGLARTGMPLPLLGEERFRPATFPCEKTGPLARKSDGSWRTTIRQQLHEGEFSFQAEAEQQHPSTRPSRKRTWGSAAAASPTNRTSDARPRFPLVRRSGSRLHFHPEHVSRAPTR